MTDSTAGTPRRGAPRPAARWMVGLAAAVTAFTLISACRPDYVDAPDRERGDASADAARSARTDLGAALAYARQVELPEELSFLDFHQPDAVFEAAGVTSFTETVRAAVVDADGEEVFRLNLLARHQADPLGFHAAGGMGGSGGLWEVAAELKEAIGDLPVDPFAGMLPDTIEVVRIGEDWWTLSSGEWSGPKSGDYVTVLNRSTPARQVSATFQSLLWAPGLEAEGREEVEGLVVDRYRFVDDSNRMTAFWNGLAPDLPNEPLPGDARGELEVWMHESGMVVRANLRAEDAEGRVFQARLDLSSLGRPVEITPPI